MDTHWQQCFDHFLQSYDSASTKYRYGLILSHFFADKPSPELVTRADCEDFIHRAMTSARSQGNPLVPSPGTVNFRLSALRSMYAYASTYTIQNAEGILQPLLQSPNPTLGIKHRKRDMAHRTISPEDLKRLFDAIPLTGICHIRNRALLLFYLFSGRRREEIVSIRWSDISETTLVDEHGTLRKAYRYRYKRSKGKEGYGYAELARPVYDQIMWYLISSGRIDDIQEQDAVFIGHGNGSLAHPTRPLRGASILRILKTYAQEASIDPDAICIHLLRHVSAQARYQGGQDVLSLMNILGHASLSTTWVYLQSLTTPVDPGIALLESRFGNLREP